MSPIPNSRWYVFVQAAFRSCSSSLSSGAGEGCGGTFRQLPAHFRLICSAPRISSANAKTPLSTMAESTPIQKTRFRRRTHPISFIRKSPPSRVGSRMPLTLRRFDSRPCSMVSIDSSRRGFMRFLRERMVVQVAGKEREGRDRMRYEA